MANFKLTMNSTEVNRLGRAASLKVVTDTTRRVLNRATVLTPVDTGLLRSHNQMRVTQRGFITTGEVFNDTSYAAAVAEGTKAHTVRPKRKKVLKFIVDGHVVYARSARIPARRGRPWLWRALSEIAGGEGYKVTKL